MLRGLFSRYLETQGSVMLSAEIGGVTVCMQGRKSGTTVSRVSGSPSATAARMAVSLRPLPSCVQVTKLGHNQTAAALPDEPPKLLKSVC